MDEAGCPGSRWESPRFDGVPPMPRRGHTMTTLSNWGGGPFYSSGYDGDEDPALLVMFGQALLWNATSREANGLYLNDLHVLHLANRSWYPLRVSGSAPVPRAGLGCGDKRRHHNAPKIHRAG